MKDKKPSWALPFLLALPAILLAGALLLFAVPQMRDFVRAFVRMAVIP